MDPLHQPLAEGLRQLGLENSSALCNGLLNYLNLLTKWNAVYSLTAIRDVNHMVTHHLLDSLSVVPSLPPGTLADVGTGPGLPGIPIAMTEPEREVVLVESNHKKSAFLVQAVGSLGLRNVRVVRQRVEEFHPDVAFDTVISRAFADLSDFVRLAGHLAKPAGQLFAMKGLQPHEEIAKLPDDFACLAVRPLSVPGLSAARHLVILQKRQ